MTIDLSKAPKEHLDSWANVLAQWAKNAAATDESSRSVRYSDDEPRDYHGRWTSGGDDGGDGSREHPISCGADLDKARQLISDGKHVTLDQPDEVSTLVEQMAQEARDATAAGQPIPNYNLDLISIEGTNLFAQDNLEIPRVEMPQFSGVPPAGSPADSQPKDANGEVDLTQQFIATMQADGISTTDETVPVSHLRASQGEIDGAKVGFIADAMRAGKVPEQDIFVTKDNYILDGHHRWAAEIVVDSSDNRLGDVSIGVHRLNTDIGTALTYANDFADKWGMHFGVGGPTNVPG